MAKYQGNSQAPLLDIMGLEPRFLPADRDPPVDEDKITKLLANQLALDVAQDVVASICSYRSWYKYWSMSVVRRVKQKQV